MGGVALCLDDVWAWFLGEEPAALHRVVAIPKIDSPAYVGTSAAAAACIAASYRGSFQPIEGG